MNEKIKFSPLSFSWVAIHPNPKGVIQFIGGAFFGSFPTVFYRYLLKALFDEGYTIIALPFRFTFRHWSVSINLLKEQKVLSKEISQIANKLNYPTEVYQNPENYFWVGHSLGCKYIALLELLSGDRWRDILKRCNSDADSQIRQIEESILDSPDLQRAIKGQPSLLIAPDISDTQSAIPRPLAFIARFLDSKNLGVIPTREQTLCYISKSPLFNLTGIISFDKDTIAGSEQDRFKDEEHRRNSDVLWLIDYLKQGKFPLLHQELSGKHLAPLGIQIGNYVIELNPLTKFVQRIQDRPMERVVIQFLDKLRMRQQNLSH
ncbi:DUF1350 family protein [Coleofasciculus sp. G2-EDA-02]|uniref:DUF1350 family protein n=1 Tax=Coleofasciculus sp. G2-EDA-02 TaxID=3069529 RepID=UPI0032F6B3B9